MKNVHQFFFQSLQPQHTVHVHSHLHILNANCHLHFLVTVKLENLHLTQIKNLYLILLATFLVSFNMSSLHPKQSVNLIKYKRHQFFVKFSLNICFQERPLSSGLLFLTDVSPKPGNKSMTFVFDTVCALYISRFPVPHANVGGIFFCLDYKVIVC